MLLLINFLEPKNLPSLNDLQSALNRHGFALRLPGSWDMQDAELLCDLSGGRPDHAFVEVVSCDAHEVLETEETRPNARAIVANTLGQKTACMVFTAIEEPESAAIAYMLSYCFVMNFGANCFDAELFSAQADEPLSPDVIKKEIDDIVAKHLSAS